jgi:hypothetical protein
MGPLAIIEVPISEFLTVCMRAQGRPRLERRGKKYRAGKAKREEGPVEVNAPPIEDAVMNAVKTAGHPATFAEFSEAPKTVAEWKGKTVEDAVRKLVETSAKRRQTRSNKGFARASPLIWSLVNFQRSFRAF